MKPFLEINKHEKKKEKLIQKCNATMMHGDIFNIMRNFNIKNF